MNKYITETCKVTMEHPHPDVNMHHYGNVVRTSVDFSTLTAYTTRIHWSLVDTHV